MRHLRRLLAASVLTFVLAGAALADDGIIYGGITQPGDGSDAASESVTAPSDDATLTDATVEFVRGLLDDMLTLG